MLIPTISSLEIKDIDIYDLMRVGFCYIKLPKENLVEKIQTCIKVARNFFHSSQEEKTKWRVKEKLNAHDRYQGYALRTQSKNTNAIEQIFFEADAPFGPYQSHAALIQDINETYRYAIFLPLIQAIFRRLNLSHPNFIETTENPYRSLVFQICPSIKESKNAIRLNAHKDFGLLTVLFFDEPGLEVKHENSWLAVPPKHGHVVVNLGNALELMTGKRCHSALHRVTNATDNRISMVYFFNPNQQQPLRNYIDDTLISASGEKFFSQQFAEYYEVEY